MLRTIHPFSRCGDHSRVTVLLPVTPSYLYDTASCVDIQPPLGPTCIRCFVVCVVHSTTHYNAARYNTARYDAEVQKSTAQRSSTATARLPAIDCSRCRLRDARHKTDKIHQTKDISHTRETRQLAPDAKYRSPITRMQEPVLVVNYAPFPASVVSFANDVRLGLGSLFREGRACEKVCCCSSRRHVSTPLVVSSSDIIVDIVFYRIFRFYRNIEL